MKKIVINATYGGFELSDEGIEALCRRKGAKFKIKFVDGWKEHYVNGEYISPYEFDRDDPDLVAVVEELGPKASAEGSNLKVIQIPDDVEWIIEEDDGLEWIAEVHRKWGYKR